MTRFTCLWFWCAFLVLSVVPQWIQYPPDGHATMTHYTMPSNYIAACGCTTDSEKYPTAAMSQYAFGSSTSYGPGCGRCFNLTLLNTFMSNPPFYPSVTKSVVVKVTDLCPLGGAGWCSATANKPNAGGAYINFDLMYPSSAIPDNFFPSNASYYGYTDFGVWNVSYQAVSCTEWSGYKNAAALGSVTSLGSGACCPANPTDSTNDTCPSYSQQNGIPPDTHTNWAYPTSIPYISWLSVLGGLFLSL
ncbi:hypothetical protein GLOTRDRAFT_58604 [Gloeophyllum trabeum ATCC 11539]|uniref:Expansin-like EG45 domain-containing protein n=1 Tax=Gloeophyllum trabeum (strain ATCC 11539 / FP-39264 / Madison 617) TaxID=670483 RepID=S7RVN0_GLOTA|nr:uncharacterized protein GLOTRDRAFT_58604 [Gloeophyllum trabeum ATCC 11539]EPQ57324.1 hypothetical protein GLOTRDRAFT_58604 [Gloeophyllum trabeum ATCC 11539]